MAMEDSFSNDGLWLFAILALLGFGGNGFMGGGRYGYFDGGINAYATAASQQEILFGQQFGNLDNKIDRLANGLCDATYALNNSITGEGRALQGEIANMNYNSAMQAASINANTSAQAQKILDAISTNRIADMQNQINSLQLQLATNNVIRYPSATTYNAGNSCFANGCGCGCPAI